MLKSSSSFKTIGICFKVCQGCSARGSDVDSTSLRVSKESPESASTASQDAQSELATQGQRLCITNQQVKYIQPLLLPLYTKLRSCLYCLTSLCSSKPSFYEQTCSTIFSFVNVLQILKFLSLERIDLRKNYTQAFLKEILFYYFIFSFSTLLPIVFTIFLIGYSQFPFELK